MKKVFASSTLALFLFATVPAISFAGSGKKHCTEAQKRECKLKKQQKEQAKAKVSKAQAKPKST